MRKLTRQASYQAEIRNEAFLALQLIFHHVRALQEENGAHIQILWRSFLFHGTLAKSYYS